MRFILFFLLVCVYAAPAFAQLEDNAKQKALDAILSPIEEIPPAAEDEPLEEPKEEPLLPPVSGRGDDYVTGPVYSALVREAITKRPRNFEFGTLRSYYLQTEVYDPTAELILKRMVTLAYTIDRDPDAARRKAAFDEYGQLVAAHLGNIDVISQALALSWQDKLYGDPEFYRYMQGGLMRSIIKSGTGKSLMQAYDVITLGEETMLLKYLGVEVLKTEPAHEGGVYYNMHQVRDRKHKEPYWIFVDVTLPMRYLEERKKDEGVQFSIPAQ